MQKIGTYHETNEKLEDRTLIVCHEEGAIPEDEGNDEESETLGEGVQRVGPDGGAVRFLKGFFERLGVDCEAVVLTGKGGDGPNGSCGLTSELGGVFVGLFVLLIFENDDALIRNRLVLNRE